MTSLWHRWMDGRIFRLFRDTRRLSPMTYLPMRGVLRHDEQTALGLCIHNVRHRRIAFSLFKKVLGRGSD